ncbi:MAG: hypothetical protein ACQEQ7_13370, partial [Thermodesulfobacteriota bacterium]
YQRLMPSTPQGIRKLKGGVIAVIGWLLSPLTWWNNWFVNLPLAYVCGYLFSLISESLFLPFMITGYWITNIAGLFLLHKGVVKAFRKEETRANRRKALIKDVAVSLIYTDLILVLFQLDILRLPEQYFSPSD